MDQSNYIPCYNIFDTKSIFVVFLYRHYLLFRSIDCSVALLFDDNKMKMAGKSGKKQKENALLLLLFDDNKMKMARKPGKKQKENALLFDDKIKMARKLGKM